VVSDAHFPDSSDYGAFAAMRELAPSTPIIAVTGGSTEHDVAAIAGRLGVAETIFKPFTRRVLLAAIERALAAAPKQA
jgi:DNA-binding NtrC family response regulator